MRAFRVGQQVQCIKVGLWLDDVTMMPMVPGPRKGDVLVIDAIWLYMGEQFLVFADYPLDAWLASQFRPLVRTDISCFTRMLEKAPKREGVDA